MVLGAHRAILDFTELAGTARSYLRSQREADQIAQEVLASINYFDLKNPSGRG
jgi:hypothetical protein